MYDVPSSEDVTKVVITDKTINDEVDPELYDSEGNLLNDSKTSALSLSTLCKDCAEQLK